MKRPSTLEDYVYRAHLKKAQQEEAMQRAAVASTRKAIKECFGESFYRKLKLQCGKTVKTELLNDDEYGTGYVIYFSARHTSVSICHLHYKICSVYRKKDITGHVTTTETEVAREKGIYTESPDLTRKQRIAVFLDDLTEAIPSWKFPKGKFNK